MSSARQRDPDKLDWIENGWWNNDDVNGFGSGPFGSLGSERFGSVVGTGTGYRHVFRFGFSTGTGARPFLVQNRTLHKCANSLFDRFVIFNILLFFVIKPCRYCTHRLAK